MGRKSKKRRFYPEFYSDNEYREMIKKRNADSRDDVIPPAAKPDAEGAEDGRRIDYSEQELTDIYSRLKGTEAGNENLAVPRQLDIGLENFKNEFIEETKKFSTLSPENPLKGIEVYPAENLENDTAPPLRIERSPLESEPENGGYIEYDRDQISEERINTQETFNLSLNEIINEEEYEASTMEDIMTLNTNDAANDPDEIAAFSDDYIDPDEFAGSDESEETMAYTDLYPHDGEFEEYDESDAMDTFSDHYIAPGETLEPETYEESEESLETMEQVVSPPVDISPHKDISPSVNFAPYVVEKENIANMNYAKAESNLPEYAANPSNTGIKPYDREAAVRYAHRWALDRNAEYYDYDEIGGDCTNYASQVLYAGGCAMDFTPNSGWYYKSGNLKSPSWTGVEQLYNFLVGEKVTGPMGREVDISEAEPGDLVNLSFNGKTYQHCPVIVKVKRTAGFAVSPKDIFICAHSYDCENRPLDTYTWKKMRFIKIVGTK